MNYFRILLKTAIMILLIAGLSNATTHYVAKTGSDSNTGHDSTNAFLTIRKCCDVLVAGDTCLIVAGVYNDTCPNAWCYSEYDHCGPLSPKNSGTAGNPIVFKGYPGQRPILKGNAISGDYSNWAVELSERSYITLDSLIIKKAICGIHFDGSDHIEIKNCVVCSTGGRGAGNNAGGVFMGYTAGAQYITVQGCSLFNNDEVVNEQTDRWNSSGIHVYLTKNSIFENNTIFDQGNGIRLKHRDTSNVIRNNVIFDCWTGVAVGNPTSNNQVYENIIHHCGRGIDVLLDKDWGGPPWGDSLTRIYNNTIYDCPKVYDSVHDEWVFGYGIIFDGGASDAQHRADTVYNNIVVNAESETYHEFTVYDSYHTNLYEDYNCYWNSGTSTVIYYHGTEYTLPNYVAATPYSDHSISSNPLFVDPPTSAYDATWDLSLQAGSPCIGTGLGGIDMGAYLEEEEPPAATPKKVIIRGERIPNTTNYKFCFFLTNSIDTIPLVCQITKFPFTLNWILPEKYQCGDINQDETVDIGDVIYLLEYVFYGGTKPICGF